MQENIRREWIGLRLQSNLPTYQLRAGETLYSVARKRGVTMAELVALNPNISSMNVRPGTVIRVPYVGMSTMSVSSTVPSTPVPITVESPLVLHDQMRMLWEQHVWWTRELIISILGSLPDEAEVTNRLLMNPAQIAALFRPAFGAQAEQAITQLLTEHLVIAAELLKAAKVNNTAAFEDANRRWYENADAIAAALASLGPQFPEEEMRQMLYRHLDLTKQEVAARLAGDYEKDIASFDMVEQQALMMADVFSQGIEQAGR